MKITSNSEQSEGERGDVYAFQRPVFLSLARLQYTGHGLTACLENVFGSDRRSAIVSLASV